MQKNSDFLATFGKSEDQSILTFIQSATDTSTPYDFSHLAYLPPLCCLMVPSVIRISNLDTRGY